MQTANKVLNKIDKEQSLVLANPLPLERKQRFAIQSGEYSIIKRPKLRRDKEGRVEKEIAYQFVHNQPKAVAIKRRERAERKLQPA